MVGVLAAGGMMGGLALFLANMTKQQMQTQKKSETGVEVVAMSQRIVRTLYDGDACLNTIGAGTAISPGGSITVNTIKNKDGEDVYKSLDNDPNAPAYGNRLLKVKSLKVVVPPSPNPITGDQAEAKLEVVMRRESTAYTGQKTVTKKFPITLELDASKQLTGCVSDVSAIADPLTEKVCKDVFGSGAWDGTLKECNPGACPSGEFMEGFDGTGKVCKTPPKIADKTCPSGEAFNKLENGALKCEAVSGTPVTCPTGKIDLGGYCVAATCPTGKTGTPPNCIAPSPSNPGTITPNFCSRTTPCPTSSWSLVSTVNRIAATLCRYKRIVNSSTCKINPVTHKKFTCKADNRTRTVAAGGSCPSSP